MAASVAPAGELLPLPEKGARPSPQRVPCLYTLLCLVLVLLVCVQLLLAFEIIFWNFEVVPHPRPTPPLPPAPSRLHSSDGLYLAGHRVTVHRRIELKR